MVLAPQKKLFYFLGGLAIFLIPFLFLNLPSWQQTIEKYLFVVILVEFFIYLFMGLWQSDGRQIIHILVCSVAMCVARIILCIIGSFIYASMGTLVFSDIFMKLWIGNPLAQLLQILLMLAFIPYILVFIAPGLFSDEDRKILFPTEVKPPKQELSRESHLIEPMDGFIRVYSFQELQNCFRKTIGLEGFIIYDTNGLIIWEDLAINFDIQKLVVRFMQLDKNMDGFIKDFDFIINERIAIETPGHMLFNIKMKGGFYLIAFFNKKIQLPDIYPRMKVLTKSTEELLKSRYQIIFNFK